MGKIDYFIRVFLLFWRRAVTKGRDVDCRGRGRMTT